MNFSRGLYFTELCRSLCNVIPTPRQIQCILEEIDSQIHRINERATGYWRLTDGDAVFIRFLKRLRDLLEKPWDNRAIQSLAAKAKTQAEETCRVVFLAAETFCWPSLESVYQAMCDDPRFDVKLVHIPFEHENSQSVDFYAIYTEKMGLPALRHTEYDFSSESPDIVFFHKPYDYRIPKSMFVKEIERVVPRLVYIAYGMEITKSLMSYGFQRMLQVIAWRHIVYGESVLPYAARYGLRHGENVVPWGHPRSDCYRDFAKKRTQIPIEWKERIDGRKVFLWNTHHFIQPGTGLGTWLQWKDTILEYFSRHKDVFLLWRPHPLLFGAVVNGKHMSPAELDSLLQNVRMQENILIDDSWDYRNAFYSSDAIITDGTSFFAEYLFTPNPILLTPRNLKQYYDVDKLKASIHIAEKEKDITDFIDMVQKGRDDLQEERNRLRSHMFTIPEHQTIGESIRDHVYQDLMAEKA